MLPGVTVLSSVQCARVENEIFHAITSTMIYVCRVHFYDKLLKKKKKNRWRKRSSLSVNRSMDDNTIRVFIFFFFRQFVRRADSGGGRKYLCGAADVTGIQNERTTYASTAYTYLYIDPFPPKLSFAQV